MVIYFLKLEISSPLQAADTAIVNSCKKGQMFKKSLNFSSVSKDIAVNVMTSQPCHVPVSFILVNTGSNKKVKKVRNGRRANSKKSKPHSQTGQSFSWSHLLCCVQMPLCMYVFLRCCKS